MLPLVRKWSWVFLGTAIAVLVLATLWQGPPPRVGAQDYNAYTTVVTYNPTVNLTAVTTPQIPANLRRIYLRCTNDSANVIYLSLGSAPALASGVRLNITGGNTFEVSDRLGTLWQGSVSAITGTTATTLLCVEGSQ
jgi:hypothetical protein